MPAKAAGAVRKAAGRPAALVRSAARVPKAVFTPFRLVLLAIATVVIATSYWAWQARQKEHAAAALKAAVERGAAALASGNFLSAGTDYRIAAEALELLGRDDPEARSVRQIAREMDAANHLAMSSLPDIAAECVKNRASGEERAAGAFRALHAGRWIVIDANLVRVPFGDAGDRLALDYPLVVEGQRFMIDAELPVLRRLAQPSPRRVIFAGQLEACRPAAKRSRELSISFRPETAFLWCLYDTLPSIGFDADGLHKEEALRKLLAEQCRAMGVEP